jgi:hypothetical protein
MVDTKEKRKMKTSEKRALGLKRAAIYGATTALMLVEDRLRELNLNATANVLLFNRRHPIRWKLYCKIADGVVDHVNHGLHGEYPR